MNSMQLLYYQAPISAVMLLCLMPFFENLTGPEGALEYAHTQESLVAIMVSGLIVSGRERNEGKREKETK